jgi:hypothetical protein
LRADDHSASPAAMALYALGDDEDDGAGGEEGGGSGGGTGGEVVAPVEELLAALVEAIEAAATRMKATSSGIMVRNGPMPPRTS